MGKKRPLVSVEDQALFLSAIEGTQPLAKRDRVPVPPKPPSVVKVAELPPTTKLTVEGDGHRYVARAPGVNRAQVNELRAGKLHVEETLDLHGDTVARGLERLREFLVVASGMRRCVLVVHGKGTHSEVGAPLREAVLAELLGACSGYVHALATAAPSHGGEGATYILLRGPR
jgi:DNA-nicking Smr family endonuclease